MIGMIGFGLWLAGFGTGLTFASALLPPGDVRSLRVFLVGMGLVVLGAVLVMVIAS